MNSTKMNKSQRIISHGNCMQCIADLPNETLTKVWEYLPKTSVALFAVALTAPSSSWQKCKPEQRQPSSASRAVTSSVSSLGGGDVGWEVLDFADIDIDPVFEWVPKRQQNQASDDSKSENDENAFEANINMERVEMTLANKLTDDDIYALLVCIDAVHKVKRLKLTGCVNMTGRGLEPLQGSSVLEQIDLSLVKEHERPEITTEPLISVETVVPILGSIIENEGSMLRQLQIPDKWKCLKRRSSHRLILENFYREYSRLLESRPFNCTMCAGPVGCSGIGRGQWILATSHRDFGMQDFTCFKCLQNCCNGEEPDDDDSFLFDNPPTTMCEICCKNYCDRCKSVESCHGCRRNFCKVCLTESDCQHCSDRPHKRYCIDCMPKTAKCKKCGEKEHNICGSCTYMSDCGWCADKFCTICLITCDDCGIKGCCDCGTPVLLCDECGRASCAQCTENSGTVQYCEICETDCCLECLEERMTNGDTLCFMCKDMLSTHGLYYGGSESSCEDDSRWCAHSCDDSCK